MRVRAALPKVTHSRPGTCASSWFICLLVTSGRCGRGRCGASRRAGAGLRGTFGRSELNHKQLLFTTSVPATKTSLPVASEHAAPQANVPALAALAFERLAAGAFALAADAALEVLPAAAHAALAAIAAPVAPIAAPVAASIAAVGTGQGALIHALLRRSRRGQGARIVSVQLVEVRGGLAARRGSSLRARRRCSSICEREWTSRDSAAHLQTSTADPSRWQSLNRLESDWGVPTLCCHSFPSSTPLSLVCRLLIMRPMTCQMHQIGAADRI